MAFTVKDYGSAAIGMSSNIEGESSLFMHRSIWIWNADVILNSDLDTADESVDPSLHTITAPTRRNPDKLNDLKPRFQG